MPMPLIAELPVAVIGAGAMGAGIAQVAASAGHEVRLHDTRAGAAKDAVQGIRAALSKLRDKGRITPEAFENTVGRLRPVDDLVDLRGCALAVEAIVENLDAKRALFARLESVLGEQAVLATNTSSISITAIGCGLQRPERLVGMHFFNPAPVMALVEVVSGAATAREVADSVFATAARWGKSPVHARSTPGFIVNRVARPFYAEGLRLLQEGAADVATLDVILRDCGGFRMGPFELMDLIGNDVNYSVTRSVFDAYYGDPRFQPSLIQLELVNAGYFGRKSGRGFYDYRPGASAPAVAAEPACERPARVSINFDGPLGPRLAQQLQAAGCEVLRLQAGAPGDAVASIDGASLFSCDGRTATERAAHSGLNGTVLIDALFDPEKATRVAMTRAWQCPQSDWAALVGLMQAAGFAVSPLADVAGMAVTRTVAMLANEAADAVNQQVCDAASVDVAMRKGVGYPIGPLEWAGRLGTDQVLGVLDNLQAHYGEPRYRASPWLRQKAWAAQPLHD